MIYQVFTFLVLLFGGGSVWYLISYVIGFAQNHFEVNYPQYALLGQSVFIDGLLNAGFLIICMVPAIIYLWSNTQRP